MGTEEARGKLEAVARLLHSAQLRWAAVGSSAKLLGWRDGLRGWMRYEGPLVLQNVSRQQSAFCMFKLKGPIIASVRGILDIAGWSRAKAHPPSKYTNCSSTGWCQINGCFSKVFRPNYMSFVQIY
jgi:hypothetical protein